MDWHGGSTIAVEVRGGNFSGLQRLTRPETGRIFDVGPIDSPGGRLRLMIPWRASQVMMVHVDG
ncbi:hypothetical protein CFAM422_005004 [Trichoderma lentiforme]|uniref:Uncharacterized protein n=1 Tax=Trichoderma lentiforme TaxID=1567552 RepID=A0A9P4XG22_9HYPO|nr:hypothetical protein CFAM422_005004 [Trichoderma lentiforme]